MKITSSNTLLIENHNWNMSAIIVERPDGYLVTASNLTNNMLTTADDVCEVCRVFADAFALTCQSCRLSLVAMQPHASLGNHIVIRKDAVTVKPYDPKAMVYSR